MRNTIFTVILLFGWVLGFAQPQITDLSYPFTVDIYSLYEISFKMGSYSNPYDPDTISVYAIFTGPDNRCDTVFGFYYEGYNFYNTGGYEHYIKDNSQNGTGWRIRFTPNAIGTWKFRIHAEDQEGETTVPFSKPIPYSFSCLSVDDASGFIKKRNTNYLCREVVKNGRDEHDK